MTKIVQFSLTGPFIRVLAERLSRKSAKSHKVIMRHNIRLTFGGVLVLLAAVWAAGCSSSRPLLLESRFAEVVVGQSSASEVLNLMPEDGLLHTASAVSAWRKEGWSEEIGIVVFGATDSLVERKEYLQKRSQQVPIFTHEKLLLMIQTTVPQELLDEPYETDTRKHAAILSYCHKVLIEDVKPFTEDQSTVELMGMARSALGAGMSELPRRPRQARTLLGEAGFAFDHPVMGASRLYLKQDAENIFTVTVTCGAWVDPFNLW